MQRRKRRKLSKHIIYWLVTGLIASTTSHLALELLQRLGFTSTYPPLANFLVGTGILFILYILLSALLASPTLGGIGLFITALVIGIINRAKIHYRAEPLFPSEFILVKEVPFLIEMVRWWYILLIGITIILSILLVIYFYRKKLKPKKPNIPRPIEWSSRIFGVLIAGLTLFYLSQFHETNHALKNFYNEQGTWQFDDQLDDYQNNGFIACFLAALPSEPMRKPDNYSKQAIQEIVDTYQMKADQINQTKGEAETDTNILFVMNESFSDPFNLKGIESAKDPLTNFRKITHSTLSGHILSPTFGGGTNANEFQALTGFSLEPLNPQITSPYVQLEDKLATYPALTKTLKSLNYQTTAIHPYDKNFFKRADVYTHMQFDTFLHEDNMTYTDKPTGNHLFISDASAYQEAFDVLNQSPETDFIHIVTMQNHTPYADMYDEVAYEVEGSGNADEANGYFQGLEVSDEALKHLIDTIDQHPEPILLFFWGDHLPGLYRGFIREANEEFTLRQTPFFVYSNAKEIDGDVDTTSPIYFKNWVNEWLEFTISPYDALLLALEEELALVDNGFYLEAGQLKTSRDELSAEALGVLEAYALIMYDVTTGEQYAQDLDFFTP